MRAILVTSSLVELLLHRLHLLVDVLRPRSQALEPVLVLQRRLQDRFVRPRFPRVVTPQRVLLLLVAPLELVQLQQADEAPDLRGHRLREIATARVQHDAADEAQRLRHELVVAALRVRELQRLRELRLRFLRRVALSERRVPGDEQRRGLVHAVRRRAEVLLVLVRVHRRDHLLVPRQDRPDQVQRAADRFRGTVRELGERAADARDVFPRGGSERFREVGGGGESNRRVVELSQGVQHVPFRHVRLVRAASKRPRIRLDHRAHAFRALRRGV
eukprot:30497-Pelagococcus_subviridis.AAC.32